MNEKANTSSFLYIYTMKQTNKNYLSIFLLTHLLYFICDHELVDLEEERRESDDEIIKNEK